MKILLVHGRNHIGKDPEESHAEWLAAIERGCATAGLPEPQAESLVMPFYGDRFETLLTELDAPLAADIAKRDVATLDSAYLEFRSSFFEEVRAGAGITDAQVAAELETLGAEREPSRVQRAQAACQALDKYMPRLTQGALDGYVRDLWVYLANTQVREEIDRVVGAGIGTEPTVVVGHSLGSLIAYSLLRRVHNRQVPRLITLGSPLGLTAVRNQFRPLKFPDGVSAWYNAYDERDLIALRGLGPTVFPVEPPVRNDKRIVNQSRNCHGSAGYLETAEVARLIFDLEQAAKS